MAFQLSPGVNVSEIDLTTVVPSVSTSAGAFAGAFQWGPVNKKVLIPDEITLVSTFGKPDSNTYTGFFTCASFLAYGNNLTVTRAANNTTFNADSNTSSTNIQVANPDVFEISYLNSNNANTYGPFMARFPGSLGNTLSVSVADANSFAGWAYSGYFNGKPGTSTQVASAGGANDEIHIAVVDSGGVFSGTKGTVLETFPYVSKALDSTDALGNGNYYKRAVFNNSKYVYAIDPVSYATTSATWGQAMANTNFAVLSNSVTVPLSGGTDAAVQDGDLITAYGQFTNANEVDISLVMTGAASVTVQQNAIDNISLSRLDCVTFVSPPSSAVINQAGNESGLIAAWVTSLARSSSYAFADSGWKYMFDKYNNMYRYVPLNGDMAGLCAYTDSVRDAWWSPAGYNRGNLKNVVKLAWNPNKTYMDALYSIGVNPVVSFQGDGIILYGDKTLQSKPSAFDRINVRRLFIVLEKAIARAAKYSLFDFNDEFTRAQFVSLVTPFLRDVQGRRGIFDFRVVCDSTNNTGQIMEANKFVGDIYIKPARSINYIQLNFVAVRTGVDFSEIVGKF